jgi:hypothetical protein
LPNPIFLATVQATEQAVVNAFVAAQTMTGPKGHTVAIMAFALNRGTARRNDTWSTDGQYNALFCYSLNAMPLNAATPGALDVAARVKSP